MAFDSLGREIGSVKPQDLLGPVGERKPFNPGRDDSAENRFFDRLLKAFADLKDVIAGAVERAKGTSQQVIDQHVSVENTKSGRSRSNGGSKLRDLGGFSAREFGSLLQNQTNDFSDNFKLLNSLAKAGLHKGSVFTHDIHGEDGLKTLIKINAKMFNQNQGILTALKDIGETLEKNSKSGRKKKNGESADSPGVLLEVDPNDLSSDASTAALAASQHRGGRRGRHDADFYDRRLAYGNSDLLARWDIEKIAFDLNKFRYFGDRAGRASQAMMEQEGRPNPMAQGLFGGINGVFADLGQANNYQKAIAEVAYATQGITAETQKQQALYRANSEMADIAVSSGWDKVSVEKSYLKLLKQGYRSQKDTVKITKTSANLATMIGSNFESTSDFANDLHMSLGLSADAVGDIARGMQQTARSSKISGDALIQAAQGAKPFLEAMKKAGILTGGVAKNMIDLQASTQKFGVSDSFQDLFAGMTGANSVMGAGFETQSLMSIMGGFQGLMPFMDGRMASDKGMQKQGMQNLSRYVGQLTGGMDLRKLGAMTEEDLAAYINDNWQLNLAIKGQTGKELGELVKGFKAFQEATMSFEDHMGDINKKLAKANLTEEERNKLLKQQADMLQGQRAEVGARALLSLDGAKSLEEGYARMRRNKTTMNTLGESARTGLFGEGFDEKSLQTDQGLQQALQKTMMDSFAKTNEILAKSADMGDDKFRVEGYESKIKTAFESGNIDQIIKLQKQMGEAQEAATSAQMADTDPARAAAKGINSLNALFKEKMDDALMYLKLIAGANLIQGTGIASFIASGLSVLLGGDMKGVLFRLDKTLGNGKMGGLVKGVASGVKEGLGLDKAASMAKGGIQRAGNKAYGAAKDFISNNSMVQSVIKRMVPMMEAAKDLARTQYGRLANAAAPARAFAGRAIANPGRGLKEGILRFAQFQDKIPLWGKFASKMGGGAEAAGVIARHAASGAGRWTSAAAPGVIGASATVGAQGIAKVAAKAALPLMVFQTAMESVGQAMKTGAHAAEIFGDVEGKVSSAHRHAAENAGMLTGVLNSLTFGIFDHWIGATGTITNSMARLIDGFPLLNAALSVLMIPLKAIYGVFWGLVAVVEEVGKGIWNGFMEFVNPVVDAFASIGDVLFTLWDVVADVLSPLQNMFGGVKEGINWVDIITGSFRMFGKVLGGIAHAIGWVVSVPLKALAIGIKAVTSVVGGLVNVVGAVIKPFVAAFAWAVGGVIDAFKSIFKIFTDIVTLKPLKIFSGFGEMWSGITSGFWDGFNMIIAPIQDVWNELKSTFWEVLEPLRGFGTALQPIVDALKDMFSGGSGLSIGGSLKTVLKGLGSVIGFVLRVTGGLIGMFLKTFVPTIKLVINVFGILAKTLMQLCTFDFSGAFDTMKTGLTRSIPKMLADVFVAAISTLGSTISKVFFGIGRTIYDAVTGLFSTVMGKIVDLVYMIPGIDWIIGEKPTGNALGNPPTAFSAVDNYTNTASTVGATPNTAISARPLSDIQTRVEQDYATSQPASSTVSSTELAKVSDLTQEQVKLMTMQLDELREIKNLLQPGSLSGSSEVVAGSTRTQSKPRSSTNFFGLSFGGYGGNASKGYVNDGVT